VATVSILAIDPGTEVSGFVVIGTHDEILDHGIIGHAEMLNFIELWRDRMAVEMVVSYGKPIGKSTIETIFHIGRYVQAYERPDDVLLIPRKTVTKFICMDAGAKDPQIRQALIDLYPRTGGGKIPQIGVKGNAGPLYGMRKDEWAALALAFTAREHWSTYPYPTFNEHDDNPDGVLSALLAQEQV
jgi:hypothetical protein